MDGRCEVADAAPGVEKNGLDNSGGRKKKQPDEQSWACFCDVKINMSSSFELFLHVSLKVPLPAPSLYCSSSFVN